MEDYEYSSRRPTRSCTLYVERTLADGRVVRDCMDTGPMTFEEACQLREDQELFHARNGVKADVSVF